MARPTETRVGRGADVALDRRQPVQLRPVARPVDQTVVPENINNDPLSQFASGLAALNPQIEQYIQRSNTNKALDANELGVALANKQELESIDPNVVVRSPIAIPDTVAPAFHQQFERGYRETLGARIGEKTQGDLLDSWTKVRLEKPEEAEQFIQEWTRANTAGHDDPLVLSQVSKRLAEATKAIRADARNILQGRAIESAKESVAVSFGAIRADQSTEEMFNTFRGQIIEPALKTGLFTRTELAGMLLDRINAISTQMGGAPELYDQVFNEYKDPATGKTLAEMNPRLAEAVARARVAADATLEQKMERDSQKATFDRRIKWDQRVASGDLPSLDEIRSEIGPRGMFKTDNEALAYYHGIQRDAMKHGALIQGVRLAQSGMLFMVGSAEDQRKVMDTITGPLVGQMFQAIQSPDPAARELGNRALAQLLNAHAASNSAVPNTALKNRFEAIRQMAPGRDAEPTPDFVALADWYSQMPANLKAVYVTDDDTRAILEIYTKGRSGGLDGRSAFQSAFTAVSPETKRAVQQQMADPEFRTRIRDYVKGETVAWSRFKLFGTYPTNEDTVFAAAELEAERFMRTNPHLLGNKGVLEAHLEKWVKDRFVHDRGSNTLVEVPPGRGQPDTEEAITEYIERMKRKHGGDALPTLFHLGNGSYQLRAGGAAGNLLEPSVRLDDIIHDFRSKRILDTKTGEDKRLVALQRALMDGTATPEMLNAESDLIAKAKAIGAWDRRMLDRVVEVRGRALREQVLPALSNLPKASNQGLDNSRLPTTDTSKQELARLYWDQNQSGKALTVLGEGVVSKVYKDAGGVATIGIGYNMESNAGTLREDFRRAGVPADRIDDIRNGRAALTRDQIMRLFDISYTRAEESARRTLDGLYGKDAWNKLGAHRRAVLVDLAFNVGNISTFPQTLQRFMTEMGTLEEQNFKVHYRNKEGQMVPLEARNNLRLAMLNGMTSFQSVVNQVGSKPRSIVQTAALKQ